MRHIALLYCLFIVLLVGCEQVPLQPKEQATAEIKSEVARSAETGSVLFHQALTPQLFELPNEALASWRSDLSEKPALVLFSSDPLLRNFDSSLQERAQELTRNGTPEKLRLHGNLNVADPVILPIQTVTAALAAEMFSKFYWIYPASAVSSQQELENFRVQMLDKQLLTQAEADSIALENGILSGHLRGIPFEAVSHTKLIEIPEPMVLHIDMGFFRGLYKNEEQSPLYTLLYDTVTNIRQSNMQPLTTTLSYSTIEGAVSLDVRFIINNLAEIMRNPKLLEELPEEWRIRRESLSTGATNSADKKIELAQQMVKLAPNSAAAHYDLFQAYFFNKQLEPALEELAAATQLDSGYAAGYFELAKLALQAGNTVMGLDFLTLAGEKFPENSFVPLQKAELLANFKQYEEAEKYLAKIPENWSPLFHENIPASITALKKKIADGQAEIK